MRKASKISGSSHRIPVTLESMSGRKRSIETGRGCVSEKDGPRSLSRGRVKGMFKLGS